MTVLSAGGCAAAGTPDYDPGLVVVDSKPKKVTRSRKVTADEPDLIAAK